MLNITKRISELSQSPTLALDSKVKKLQKEGEDIINFGIGEPNFNTPLNIKKAANNAIKDNFTHYTEAQGILELRTAISKKFQIDNKINYQPSEIIVSTGSKQVLYNALMVTVEKGDEVLVPTPTWSTYVEQIKLTEGKPVLIPLEKPFKLKSKDIEKYISKKTKALIINSPSNPTGAMIEKSELEKISLLAIKNNIWVISDEIYEKITYGGKHTSIASLNNKIKNQTITVNGFSKSYAMTGWRIGYAGGPLEVISAMNSLQGQTTSNASSISQKAGLEALIGTQDDLINMVKEFNNRRKILLTEMTNIKSLEVIKPEGAFYLFVKLKKTSNSSLWAEELLNKAKVAVVPGEAFMFPGYFRLSFAVSETILIEGIKRIRKFEGYE